MKLNAFNVILTAEVLLKAESFRRVHGRLYMWEEIYINNNNDGPEEVVCMYTTRTLHPRCPVTAARPPGSHVVSYSSRS